MKADNGAASRIAVDIGGTFTDIVLEHEGTSFTAKELTASAAPEEGVLAGVGEVLARSGAVPGDIALVIHGTTLATNAIIERKGALTALLTTEGFRDVLDIGYRSTSCHCRSNLHIVLLQNLQSVKNFPDRLPPQT